jgi:hypothetical protein
MIHSLGQPINNNHETIKYDILNLIPDEISLEILSYLNQKELTGASLVNKTWKVLADSDILWNELYLRENLKKAFRKENWKNFGDIGEEPPLPKGIINILKKPCPFSPGKTVGETHRLMLIPETMDGKPLTLITFKNACKNAKDGFSYLPCTDNCEFLKKHGEQPTGHSYWVLMTNETITRSLIKDRTESQAITLASCKIPELMICFAIKDREFVSQNQYLESLHLGQLAGMDCYTPTGD